MGLLPEVNLADERIEWPSGTRREAVSPYLLMQKTVYDPVVTTDPIPIGIFSSNSDITNIYSFVDGSSTPSVTFSIMTGTDIGVAGTHVVTTDASTSTTTLYEATVEEGSASTGDMIWMEITAKTGIVESFTVILRYRTRV